MLPLSWKAPGELAWVVPEYDVVAVFPEILRSDSNEDESIGAFAGVGCGGIWSGRRNGATTGVPTCAGHSRSSRNQKKEIKDPAEYNAYVGAVQQTDPAAKISGLEAFLTQYPNSVMKEDALELLMGTYQQAGNQAKVIDTANRLLAVNPDNTRALVLLAYNERAAQKWPDAKQHAERGLTALAK